MNSISLKCVRRPENNRNEYAVMHKLMSAVVKFTVCDDFPELPYGGPADSRGTVSSLREGDWNPKPRFHQGWSFLEAVRSCKTHLSTCLWVAVPRQAWAFLAMRCIPSIPDPLLILGYASLKSDHIFLTLPFPTQPYIVICKCFFFDILALFFSMPSIIIFILF